MEQPAVLLVQQATPVPLHRFLLRYALLVVIAMEARHPVPFVLQDTFVRKAVQHLPRYQVREGL